MSSIFYYTRIEDQTKIHTIKWKVPNFNELAYTTNRELLSKVSNELNAEASDSRFQVKIRVLGQENDLIGIYYLSPTHVFLKFVFKIVFYSGRGPEQAQDLVESYYHTVQANKWLCLSTLKKSTAMPWCKNENFFRFEFFVKDIQFDQTNSPEVQLINDIENLFNNGLFYDATIKSAEGVKYKVHKAVLASRSAVLKAHFEHNTTECVTNIVESPLESELLRDILTFIYSGKAPRIDEIPEKLLAAANYYQLSGLIGLCEEALHKKLTAENAIETLKLADLYSANTLKQLTLKFIKNGPNMPAIIKTGEWAKLKSVELIKEIFEYGLMTTDTVNPTN